MGPYLHMHKQRNNGNALFFFQNVHNICLIQNPDYFSWYLQKWFSSHHSYTYHRYTHCFWFKYQQPNFSYIFHPNIELFPSSYPTTEDEFGHSVTGGTPYSTEHEVETWLSASAVRGAHSIA